MPLISVAEAYRRILAAMHPLPIEEVPLAEAVGRVLRRPLVADRDLPPFDRVMLDGYALRAAELGAGRREYRVAGVQAAGQMPLTLPEGEEGVCVEVMTGSVLPGGADCVVPYEAVERAAGAQVVAVAADFTGGPGHAVHARGSDHRPGECIVETGTRLTAPELAVAAGVGAATIEVTMPASIAVIATGDELVDVSMPVLPHQIRRSNDHALGAALRLAGHRRVVIRHLRDVRHEIEAELRNLLARHDVLVLTGGVSRGRYDYLPEVLAALGVEKVFHGVAQRPGKPFWFGLGARRVPVFALPGNPVSCLVGLRRYVLPALSRMEGLALGKTTGGEFESPAGRVVLGADASAAGQLARLLPARLCVDDLGRRVATPVPMNTSGDFTGLVGTDGFVELAPGPVAAGALVPWWPW